MGANVSDIKHRETAIRCPEESPPGSVEISLVRVLGSTSTPKTITVANDATLISKADISFSAFDTSARSILANWYIVGLRDSVTVGGITYNEKEELWELYKVLS